MPFSKLSISTSKTQQEVKKALQTNFNIDQYQDKLRLELNREGGNRGFIRILFPKVKTYIKVENGKAKCSILLEIVGFVMLFVSIMAGVAAVALPPEGEESLPAWAPIAAAAWYLLYSFMSIAKIKKLLSSIKED